MDIQEFSRWRLKNIERNQETRWTLKLTKKIKGISKPETRTVLLIPTDINPVKKLTKPGFKIAPKTIYISDSNENRDPVAYREARTFV